MLRQFIQLRWKLSALILALLLCLTQSMPTHAAAEGKLTWQKDKSVTVTDKIKLAAGQKRNDEVTYETKVSVMKPAVGTTLPTFSDCTLTVVVNVTSGSWRRTSTSDCDTKLASSGRVQGTNPYVAETLENQKKALDLVVITEKATSLKNAYLDNSCKRDTSATCTKPATEQFGAILTTCIEKAKTDGVAAGRAGGSQAGAYNSTLISCVTQQTGLPAESVQTALAGSFEAVAAKTAEIDGLIAANNNPATDSNGEETCNVSGIGWIVCPVSNFIARITDGVYTVVEQLLEYRFQDDPGTPGPDTAGNPLYDIWGNIRNFANVAFIIAFFAVIFSQATNLGISNYGIKKMLPRIIAAAILVNLSFYICMFAVDVSNIMGAGIDGVLTAALNQIATPDKSAITWSDVVSNALVVGTGSVAAGVVLANPAAQAAILGAALLFAISALFAVLTALVVLVARIALITILIVISPIAFVAYILPSTEQWFDRWRKAFITLLIFYPLVALVFSGSKVAAAIMRMVY